MYLVHKRSKYNNNIWYVSYFIVGLSRSIYDCGLYAIVKIIIIIINI